MSVASWWLRTAAEVVAVPVLLVGAVVAPAVADRGSGHGRERCERLIVYREGLALNASRVMGVPESGGVPHPVHDGPAAELDPDWSPDGRELVIATRRLADGVVTDRGLDVVDVATGQARVLLRQDPFPTRFPAWSPDGRSVAYASAKDGHGPLTALRVVAADGTGDRLVTAVPQGHLIQDLEWHPGGDRILMTWRTDGYDWRLSSVDVATGETVLLDDDRELGYPRFFEHGRSRIVVEGSELDASGVPRATLYLTHPKKLEPLTRLFAAPEDQWGPAVAPDGDEVAYLQFSTHALEVVSLRDGSVRQVVAPLPGFPSQFVREGVDWQPAGRCVAGFPY